MEEKLQIESDDQQSMAQPEEGGQTLEELAPHVDLKASESTTSDTASDKTPKGKSLVEVSDPWPEMKPLVSQLKHVPQMDANLLPNPLYPWLRDVSERMQAPIEFSAVYAMGILGALIGRQVAICPQKYDDWTIPPNLWGMAIGLPASKKSPVLNVVRKPLDTLLEKHASCYREEMERWERNESLRCAKNRNTQLKINRALKAGDEASAEAFSRELESQPPKPVLRRFVTSDPSVPSLVELHESNPNGILLIRDEISGWLADLDKPSRESSRSFYLETWNGNVPYMMDRKFNYRSTKGLCLSILGGCVPGIIDAYVREALAGKRGADGLLQRFSLML